MKLGIRSTVVTLLLFFGCKNFCYAEELVDTEMETILHNKVDYDIPDTYYDLKQYPSEALCVTTSPCTCSKYERGRYLGDFSPNNVMTQEECCRWHTYQANIGTGDRCSWMPDGQHDGPSSYCGE